MRFYFLISPLCRFFILFFAVKKVNFSNNGLGKVSCRYQISIWNIVRVGRLKKHLYEKNSELFLSRGELFKRSKINQYKFVRVWSSFTRAEWTLYLDNLQKIKQIGTNSAILEQHCWSLKLYCYNQNIN